MRLSLRYAALSDVGRVRKDNQDSGFASENLLVVADGVGGSARGDVASSTAVQQIRRLDAPAPNDLLEAMAGAIHRAHDRIAELVEHDPSLDGTSTTVTAALFDGTRVGIGHVGDSRAYLFRDREISQLTKDHTFVQGLIDEGRITEEESRVHPHRNLILRAVDGVHETDPDLFIVDLVAGDRLMLCSDGCSGVLDDARLADILGTGTVDYAAVELVRASLDAGSSDNITVVVADVVEAPDGAQAAGGAAGALATDDTDTSAAAVTGPMIVGAAAEQPRRSTGAAARSFFRGHRSGDTGEMDPVPGEDQPVDPEALRYAPRPPRRFLGLRRLLVLAGILALVWIAGAAAYDWTQKQYYVAAYDGNVAIYEGVRADLPLVRLHRVAEKSEIALADLPEYPARQVRDGIDADSLEDARTIVKRLDGLAIPPCPKPTPKPTASASPTKTGTAAPTRKPNRTKSPGPTPRDNPSPSRTGTATASGGQSATATGTNSPSPGSGPDCGGAG